ncbi:type II secretion system protein GspN [Desulfonema ishimotonii]|uniref:Type II secretion system protein GspN n=1 Tax=Desulfonema ishimotonii TaxID=45657 RepID=A0A401G492_9BACT|nr:type II secretion system protein GspN [Desulfonema ishimotonii]GBC64059.1 type II secretion system protein GspN [Desulfonema ishimotonii]
MNIRRKWLLYAIYTILISGFFFYYLFPADDIKQYIVSGFQNARPDYTLKIGTLAPSLPPGLTLWPVSVEKDGRLLIRTDRVRVTPKLLSLSGETPSTGFRARAYGGTIEGQATVALPGKKGEYPPQITVDAKLSEINLQTVDAIRTLSPHRIGGRLGGHILYRGDGPSGVAEAELTLAGGEVTSEILKLAGLDALTFKTVESQLVLHNNRDLQIKSMTLKGNQVSGELSGTITFREPVEKSRLSLKGTLRPHPELFAKLGGMASLFLKNRKGSEFPFLLSGTLGEPQFSLQ